MFTFKVLDVEKDQCNVKPVDGVFIYGLYLEGAQWKKKSLADLNFVLIVVKLGLNECADAGDPLLATAAGQVLGKGRKLQVGVWL